MQISRPDPDTVPVDLRRDLLRAGWSERAVKDKLRSGEWARARYGAYVPSGLWSQLDDVGRHAVRTRAVVAASRTPMVVSHVSAAVRHGVPVWGLPLDDVHGTRTDGRVGRHEAGVHQHGGGLSTDDVETEDVRGLHLPLQRTDATRTALDLCTLTTVEAAMAAATALCRTGRTSPAELRARYERAEASMVQWPYSRTTDLVVRLVDPRLESVGECRLAHLIWRSQLPAPVPQLEVRDDDGTIVARLDFAWPDLGAFVEFDGRVKYEGLLRPGQRASDVVVAEKRREELVCRLTGWRCLRLVWADLERPERTVGLIRAFLAGSRLAG